MECGRVLSNIMAMMNSSAPGLSGAQIRTRSASARARPKMLLRTDPLRSFP